VTFDSASRVANYFGSLNPWTGQISPVPVTGPSLEPQGMIFVAGFGR
jgi:hypothetical protein